MVIQVNSATYSNMPNEECFVIVGQSRETFLAETIALEMVVPKSECKELFIDCKIISD